MRKELLGYLAVAALALLVAASVTPSEVFTAGRLVDTDAYMRLVRVRLLLDSGGWFDASVPRSNWPHGEVLHWTRPMDLVLLAGALPLRLFVATGSALHLSGIFVPTLLFLATLAAGAWAAEPVTGGRHRFLVLLLLLAQPAVAAYAQPGRPDHHGLILLSFAVGLGFLLRGLEDPRSGRWAAGLGISAALGMWVSPEFLLALGLFIVGGMAAWIRRGGELAGFNLAWTRVFAVTLPVCLLVERGVVLWPIEYDKISVAHVAVAGLALAVWTAIHRIQAARGLGTGARAAAGAGLGALSLVAMAAAFPRFFGGPMVDVTDPAVLAWLHRVRELQPLLPGDLQGAGRLLLYAGTASVAIPYLAVSLRRDDDGWEGRLLLLVGIGGVLALSLAQFRWITYVEIMSAVAVADLLARSSVVLRREMGSGPPVLVARVSWNAAVIAGPVVAGAVIHSAAGHEPAEGVAVRRCEPDAVVSFLATEPRWGHTALTVAAHPDLGPALLYRSPHRVIATPYHRNEGGFRASYDLFASTDPHEAADLVRARGIDLVALCPDRDALLFPEVVDGRASLFGRLLAGEPPSWLEEVPLPETAGTARLFLVSAASLPPAEPAPGEPTRSP